MGSYDGNLYAIKPDGSLKWSYPTGSAVVSSPAIGSDGTIYVGSRSNNKIYAINPDGTQKWAMNANSQVPYSPAISSDGTIYIRLGIITPWFYAINPDGTLKWSFATSGEGSSPAIGKDGTIYVGSDKYLQAINSDGTQKWDFETGGTVLSSPAIGTDGTVYVGSNDGNLYAINGESGGLADSPWPMFRHDLKRTGRSSYTEGINAMPSLQLLLLGD